ncbi:MAG: hypothetical protein EOO73_24410 [Myxococcales bacterium]|nr:MAG: hypothetical protein EOO73_24410 [Myxococcales bacterium]
MPRSHAYPPDLARFVEANWPASSRLALSSELFEEALAVAFHASLTTEETRLTRFRLLLTAPENLPTAGAPKQGVLRLSLQEPRALTVAEVRRLAPVAPFETSLIGAFEHEGKLRIWGVAHSGPAWLAPTWGGRGVVPNWSYDPIVHVTGPGHVAVRCAGKLIGAIERGLVVDATLDVFESQWLKAMFAREREEARALHAATQVGVEVPTDAEHSLIGKVGQHMLRRAIQLVRGAHHGGLVLVLDTEGERACRTSGLRLKYPMLQDEPSRRYRTLLLQILQTVAATSRKPSVGWLDFSSSDDARFAELEGEVFELSRVLANLTAIDGALVLDKRFGILGFGAEVSAELPSPEQVYRALDAEGTERQAESVENVGTRHRAAYRFVNDHPGGLGVVISQDGGVTFVANRGGEVVFWEQSVSP